MSSVGLNIFRESPLLFHRQKEVLDSLRKGDVSDIRVSQSFAADKIIGYGFREGFLREGLRHFPDPRKHVEVPVEVLLVPQILQRLHDEHSLLLAPYMLNDADLITTLGFNAKVLENGFNNRAKYPRQTAFHGETLKHVLNAFSEPTVLLNWFNQSWLSLWRGASPGRTRQYILDGMKIEIARPRKKKREGSGMVSDDEGNHTYGYKAVWLQEIIDKKGVIVALSIVPIQTHDIEAGRKLVESFSFEVNSVLIMDRGFIDGEWISHLKKERNVDVVVPLRKNMYPVEYAVSLVDEKKLWVSHPTREGQTMAPLSEEDLFWRECDALKSGTLVRWLNKETQEEENVLFVSTLEGKSGEALLRIYDQRTEIEESHRELKCFQGIETVLSGKFTHVVFRILMNVIAFNLLRLFLNSEECDTFEDFTAKTFRQRRKQEPNPKIIIYSNQAFATLYFLDFIELLLALKKSVREKIAVLIKALKSSLKFNSS